MIVIWSSKTSSPMRSHVHRTSTTGKVANRAAIALPVRDLWAPGPAWIWIHFNTSNHPFPSFLFRLRTQRRSSLDGVIDWHCPEKKQHGVFWTSGHQISVLRPSCSRCGNNDFNTFDRAVRSHQVKRINQVLGVFHKSCFLVRHDYASWRFSIKQKLILSGSGLNAELLCEIVKTK